MNLKELKYLKATLLENGGLLSVVMNRPKQLNALSYEMVDELHAVLDWVALPTSPVRVVVLSGAGRGFCAGADIAAVQDSPDKIEWKLEGQQRFSSLVLKMYRLPCPVVAAVHGPAAGGGFSIALAADVVVVGESATFVASFLRLGMTGGELGSSFFLPRAMGRSLAREALLTGAPVDASLAVSSGLASSVHRDADVLEAAHDLGRRMLQASPKGLRMTKESLNAAEEGGGLTGHIAMEDLRQVHCFNDPGCIEVRDRHALRFLKRSKL